MFPQRGIGRQVTLVIVPAFEILWKLIQTYTSMQDICLVTVPQTNRMVEKHHVTYRLVIGCACMSQNVLNLE